MSLLSKAQEIKNETNEGQNTASRVGGLLELLCNPPYLDAEFSGNTTAQTVGTDWEDINAVFSTNYSNLLSWELATKSFLYEDGDFPRSIKIQFKTFIESTSNNQSFEFGLFVDSGAGFALKGVVMPYTFRQSDDTREVSIGTRFDITTGSKFKLRVRKPSGSSDILFLASKVLV